MLRDGEPVDTSVQLDAASVRITAVASDSPASKALLYSGDHLLSIDGQPVTDAESLYAAMDAASGKDVPVTVEREGREVELTLSMPAVAEGDNPLAAIGANATLETWQDLAGVSTKSSRDFEKVSAGEVIPKGLDQFWFLLSGTVDGLKQMFTTAPSSDNLAGPVGMGQLTSELISESSLPIWFTIGNIVMVISVGLGILNLLPLPALDGGRLAFVVIEVLRGGKRLPPEKEGLVHLAGLALLLALMFFVAFNDVGRLIGGESILP
jgi:regulator of sigma E protease